MAESTDTAGAATATTDDTTDDAATASTDDTAGAATARATDTADNLGEAGTRALQEERRKAREAVARAKAAETELGKLRKSQMTETEKATAEAEERGRTTAMAEFGQRLVRAEFRAQAGGRVDDLDDVLDDLNLAKFIGEDGEPDTKAIARAVARLAPAAASTEDTGRAPGPRPDLSQGGSRNQTALNSDELTQALKAAVNA